MVPTVSVLALTLTFIALEIVTRVATYSHAGSVGIAPMEPVNAQTVSEVTIVSSRLLTLHTKPVVRFGGKHRLAIARRRILNFILERSGAVSRWIESLANTSYCKE